MSNQIYIHERIPASPKLNESFYVVFSTPGLATFTGGFATIASVVSPISATGASYAAFYTAGSVPVGSWNIMGFVVKGATGTFVTGTNITIQDSEIAEPVVTVYNLIKNNLAGTYASTLVSTGWYSSDATKPIITVTTARRTDETFNLNDTFRQHIETVYVDTWIAGTRDTGATLFGTSSRKRARRLLDDEVKRIINANRKAPSNKIRHLMIQDSQPLDEISDNRKVFRTRHTIRLKWDETIS